MSRKSALATSKSKFPFSATMTETSFQNEISSELKVCGDCQARHSHKGMSQSDYGLRKYQYLQNQNESAEKDDLHYLNELPQETLETSKRKDTSRNNEYSDFGGSRNKENSKSLKSSNRLFAGEGSIKKANETMNSFNDSLPRSFNDSHYKKEQYIQRREEEGEDRFMKYSEDFAADLDKATFRLESDLKRKFENTAHSLLHQHVNNKSLLENDETYRNREVRTQPNDLSFSQKKLLHTSGEFEGITTIPAEPSFISDNYPRRNDTRDREESPPSAKRIEFAATLPTSGEKWKNSTTKDVFSNTFPARSATLVKVFFENKGVS